MSDRHDDRDHHDHHDHLDRLADEAAEAAEESFPGSDPPAGWAGADVPPEQGRDQHRSHDDLGGGEGTTGPEDPGEPDEDDHDGAADRGQLSEVAALHRSGPISPGDSVAGSPSEESGLTDEGPQGPDAVTFAERQDVHPDPEDVETTG